MGAAVAVHEPVERPGWLERILVLGICAGLAVGLAVLDERAAEREVLRAQEVISERAQRAAERSSREAMTAPAATTVPRTERLGRESPVVISGGTGLGAAATVVAGTEVAEDTGGPSPQNVLRRTQGPTPSDPASVIPAPATPAATPVAPPAPAPAVAAATTATRDDGPLLLMLMAALGLSMAGGGLRLLSRRSA